MARAPRRASQRPAAIRGTGWAKRRRRTGVSRRPPRRAASASPAPPSRPVTHSPSPGRAPPRRTGRWATPSAHTSTRQREARARSPPSTLAPTLRAAAPTPAMIWTSGEALPVARCTLLGIPSETRTPRGCAPSAARSDRAAAVARQPISRNESQSVRKCTPSSDRSRLIASVRPPTGSSAQSSPRSRPAAPSVAKMARRRSNSPPGPRRSDRPVTPSPAAPGQ